MAVWLFWAAGALAGVWFLVHLFMGGREIAQPLLEVTAIEPTVRHTQYLCWHFTSVSIASMAGFYAAAAVSGNAAFAIAGTVLALGFLVIGVMLVVRLGESHARLPQGWLFLPVAALGIAGLVM
ncbi:MAG: hypothetical protein AAGG69_13270 [Pseudomonadota bacterium]